MMKFDTLRREEITSGNIGKLARDVRDLGERQQTIETLARSLKEDVNKLVRMQEEYQAETTKRLRQIISTTLLRQPVRQSEKLSTESPHGGHENQEGSDQVSESDASSEISLSDFLSNRKRRRDSSNAFYDSERSGRQLTPFFGPRGDEHNDSDHMFEENFMKYNHKGKLSSK
jgi:hypothetical protein